MWTRCCRRLTVGVVKRTVARTGCGDGKEGYCTAAAAPSALRLSHAVQCAEKVAGRSSNRLKQKALQVQELRALVDLVTRLIGSQHPFVSAAKQLLFDHSTSIQTRGLLASLLINAAGISPQCAQDEDQVRQRQNCVIEAIECFHAGQVIHAAVVNVSDVVQHSLVLDDILYGNKISVLTGDFFLTNAFKLVTDAGIPVLHKIFGESVEDYVRAHFYNDLSTVTEVSPAWWEDKTYLESCSLLANGFRAAMLVSGHDESHQEKAFDLGKYIALAFQVYQEMQPFLGSSISSFTTYDVTSLPVVLQMESNPELLDYVRDCQPSQVDYVKVHSEVVSGHAMSKLKIMLGYYVQEASNLALEMEPSKSRDALLDVVKSLHEFKI